MRPLSFSHKQDSLMTLERGQRNFPIRGGHSWERLRPVAPAWTVRIRLRWLELHIARLERQLAEEFGLLEIAPMLQEHAQLVARRDQAVRRLVRT